jgi:hypothetical protein
MQELLKQAGSSLSLSQFGPAARLKLSYPGRREIYTGGMLKGSKKAVITKIQPVSIHGQVSLDIYFLDPDDPQGQTSRARVGQESVPRSLDAGDHVELHYVLGVVTHVTKT